MRQCAYALRSLLLGLSLAALSRPTVWVAAPIRGGLVPFVQLQHYVRLSSPDRLSNLIRTFVIDS